MTVDTTTRKTQLDDMLAELDRTLSTLREDEPVPGQDEGPADDADAGTRLRETEDTAAAVVAAEDQRRQVAAALERIAEGSYGRCVDCGREIPEGRLEARPEAARDVDCQAKADAA